MKFIMQAFLVDSGVTLLSHRWAPRVLRTASFPATLPKGIAYFGPPFSQETSLRHFFLARKFAQGSTSPLQHHSRNSQATHFHFTTSYSHHLFNLRWLPKHHLNGRRLSQLSSEALTIRPHSVSLNSHFLTCHPCPRTTLIE